MRVLVLGASGMAGHMVAVYLQECGHSVTTLSRDVVPFCSGIVHDIRDFSFLKNCLEKDNYDYVINCIGILNQNAEKNHDNAVLLNSYLQNWLAKITEHMATRIIHLSTDCVFSGNKGKYKENDLPDGATFYARSKALGELDDEKNLTFRTSIIGPDMRRNGIGLFNWFMLQSEEVEGYTGAIWSGVSTLVLAQAIALAMQEKITGIYHLTNNDRVTKHELLSLLNQFFRRNNVNIHAVKGVCVDKSLVNTRTDFTFIVPDYVNMVRDLAEWVRNHPGLYVQYQTLVFD